MFNDQKPNPIVKSLIQTPLREIESPEYPKHRPGPLSPLQSLVPCAGGARFCSGLLLIVILLLLTACNQKTAPISEEKPNDFEIEYYWEVGSLPPEYFYSYTISVGPTNEGKIEFVAGYPTDDPAVWVEEFDVTEEQQDQLYAELYEAGVFGGTWEQQDDTPDGGSADKMSVKSYGREYTIPSYVDGEEKSKMIHEIYEQIEELVPDEIWEKLNEQHEQYVQEREDEE